jgi:hypothetical protein
MASAPPRNFASVLVSPKAHREEPSAPPQIRCQEINVADRERVVNLLTRGFPERSREFWDRAFDRLSRHPTPYECPKYGYLLESGGAAVGVILLIFVYTRIGNTTGIRCNVSSWYVEPAFRAYGAMLVSRALRHKDVTYFNITPAPQTLSILEALGFKRYCSGRFISIPVLSAQSLGTRVEAVTPGLCADEDLPSSEVDMLLAHAEYGCVSVTCRAVDGSRHPFVFAPRCKYGVLPFAFLIYCRALEDFVRFAGPLGRFLGRRGIPLVVLNTDGPMRGLVGTYRSKGSKHFKGPVQPLLGDVAYSELAMFGV